MTEKGCDNCYYTYFDERAYPCSLCIRGIERTDQWQPSKKTKADRKTENSSEFPNNCEDEPLTCDGNCWMKKQNGEWLCEHCQRKPQIEPTGYNLSPVDKDINVRSKDEPQTEPLQTCSVNGRPYSECSSCEHFRCTADEPQTERSE